MQFLQIAPNKLLKKRKNEPVPSYKIALICDHFLPRIGGLELQVRDLAKALKRFGHEPQILTTTPGETDIEGIKIHRIPASLMPGFKIIWNSKSLSHLRNILIQENFDIVHSHSSVVSPLAYGSLSVTKGLRTPTVLTCHSLLQKSIYTFRVLNKIYRWNRWPFVISGVSGASAEGVRQAAQDQPVSILYNGINTQEWALQPTHKSEINITSVLRLNKKKRAQDLIKAIPEILKRLPPRLQPKFNIIGKGPYQRRIQYLVNQLQLQRHVNLTGYLPRSEIKKIFSKTDLFVLPTLKEAFGIALLEARCAGLPIVAMNRGGTGDIVQHGQNGLLSNSRHEFIENITQLILNEELRTTMAKNSLEGLGKFHWNQIIQDHMDVYELAIQKVSPSNKIESAHWKFA